MLIDNSIICDSNVDLGYEDITFDVLSENVDNFLSIGYLSGYDVSVDPYCRYLAKKPKKIMWDTFLNFSFDFSMAFAWLMRALTFFTLIIFVLSYYHACEPCAAEFEKLLCALMASTLKERVLT